MLKRTETGTPSLPKWLRPLGWKETPNNFFIKSAHVVDAVIKFSAVFLESILVEPVIGAVTQVKTKVKNLLQSFAGKNHEKNASPETHLEETETENQLAQQQNAFLLNLKTLSAEQNEEEVKAEAETPEGEPETPSAETVEQNEEEVKEEETPEEEPENPSAEPAEQNEEEVKEEETPEEEPETPSAETVEQNEEEVKEEETPEEEPKNSSAETVEQNEEEVKAEAETPEEELEAKKSAKRTS